jgi:hypothetical protein
MYKLWMSSMHARGMHLNASLHPPISCPPMSSAMSSPMPSVINIPTMPDHAGPKCVNPDTIDPAMSSRMGSMTYNQNENSYNLEWESRANFNKWLTHEQATRGIEI